MLGWSKTRFILSYTHSWGRSQVLRADVFEMFLQDVKNMVNRKKAFLHFFGGIKVRGPTGFGFPIFTNREICFNGSPAFETFWLTQDYNLKHPTAIISSDQLFWDYIKTDERPYDLLVKATLIALKFHFPETQLKSEQSIEQWQDSFDLFLQTTSKKTDSFQINDLKKSETISFKGNFNG